MRSTLEDIQKLEAVAERDIDLLFIEELSISKSFRSWIYGMVWETNDHDLPFLGAWHSLIHSEYGESDIPAIFKDSHDHKTAILIENKIDALAQPNQAARYRSRGDAGIEKAWWHKYRTCMIAPQAYLDANSEAELYDVRISYESIKEWFQHVGETHRKLTRKNKTATRRDAMKKASESWPRIKKKLQKRHAKSSACPKPTSSSKDNQVSTVESN